MVALSRAGSSIEGPATFGLREEPAMISHSSDRPISPLRARMIEDMKRDPGGGGALVSVWDGSQWTHRWRGQSGANSSRPPARLRPLKAVSFAGLTNS